MPARAGSAPAARSPRARRSPPSAQAPTNRPKRRPRPALRVSVFAVGAASSLGNRNSPVGTAGAGYANPDLGPFRCGNCIHFAKKKAGRNCDHPKVVSDREVQGRVEADGCCNYFRPEDAR